MFVRTFGARDNFGKCTQLNIHFCDLVYVEVDGDQEELREIDARLFLPGTVVWRAGTFKKLTKHYSYNLFLGS